MNRWGVVVAAAVTVMRKKDNEYNSPVALGVLPLHGIEKFIIGLGLLEAVQ